MCEFMSWVETDEKNYFLTGDQVFNTTRGKMLRDYCGSSDDYTGHGAIRHYYGLDNNVGENRECTDFSTPKNFPNEIAEAVKSGKMIGLGIDEQLLTESALAKYEKIRQPALAEYEKIRRASHAEYEKIRQPAWAEYEKIRQSAYAEYAKIKQPAWAEYLKIKQPAWAEYLKIEQPACAEYEKIRQPAWAEYLKIRQPAWAEYLKIEQPACAEYEKIRQSAFWGLFADTKNRNKHWR